MSVTEQVCWLRVCPTHFAFPSFDSGTMKFSSSIQRRYHTGFSPVCLFSPSRDLEHSFTFQHNTLCAQSKNYATYSYSLFYSQSIFSLFGKFFANKLRTEIDSQSNPRIEISHINLRVTACTFLCQNEFVNIPGRRLMALAVSLLRRP